MPANALNAPSQQFSSGVGGEIQMVTNNFGLALGYTPYEFLVSNITAHARVASMGRPLYLPRRSRLHQGDPALLRRSARSRISHHRLLGQHLGRRLSPTGGGMRFDVGGEKSGLYFTVNGASLTGYHVLQNTTFAGSGGGLLPRQGLAGIRLAQCWGPLSTDRTSTTTSADRPMGRADTSARKAYFLAGIPITFNGHYKTDFHYVIAGSVGLQTFQEDNAPYYPLDPSLQTGALTGCTLASITSKTCGVYPPELEYRG